MESGVVIPTKRAYSSSTSIIQIVLSLSLLEKVTERKYVKHTLFHFEIFYLPVFSLSHSYTRSTYYD